MRGRGWLCLSTILFLVYTGYVLIAKFGKLAGLKLPFELGDIGEFWLFTACIGAFCMQIIRDERALPHPESGAVETAVVNKTAPPQNGGTKS